jgi:hypothetical protein
VGILLAQISMSMLNVSPLGRLLGNILMPSMAFALAGLSTGLGSIFMELGVKTPAQILSGYGGTLNLILSLLTVIALIMVPGIVSHSIISEEICTCPNCHPYAVHITIAYIVGVAALIGGIPLWMGARALRNRDY